MALIGTIRKNSWILVVMLGLGLGGFIVMDVSSAGGRGGQEQFSIGEVNGSPVDWIQFQSAQEALYSNSSIDVFSQRDYVWGYMIEEQLVDDEAEAIGLTVGEDEMQELLFGANLSPIVKRNFSDPNTGQLNVETLNQFRDANEAGTLAPQYQKVWDFQNKEVKKERLQAKLLQLVKKSIYTPTWMAEDIQNDVGSSVDFTSRMVAFDQIEDSEVEPTDKDYRAFIQKNSHLFDLQAETRNASFVVFDVYPTAEDTLLLLESFQALIDEFKTSDEDSILAVNNYGTYNPGYTKKDALPQYFQDSVFARQPGEIYGPFLDESGGTYLAVKVLDFITIPDSVNSRHILIGIDDATEAQTVIAKADSVVQMLIDGGSFEELAIKYSTDNGSRALGGDLGYVAEFQFVTPMNNHLFYSDAEPGTFVKIPSQFGIHIVEVLDRIYETNEIGVKFATVSETIIPSEATQDYIYDDVLEFAGLNRTLESLTAAVEADNSMSLELANNIPVNGYGFSNLTPGTNSRSIIKWMFAGGTEVNQVAPEVFIFEDVVNYFNSKYVVVALTEVNEVGLPEPNNVMDLIEGDVKKEMKGELIASRMDGLSASALDAKFEVQTDSIENVNFGTQIMKSLGDEPKVLGAAMSMELGETSKPIIGNNGVFVVNVTSRTPAAAAQNIARLRQQGSFQVASAAEFEFMNAMKRNAKIEDNRSRFY